MPSSADELRTRLYVSNVRRFIRDYYARRAQACFSHGTRNDEGLHGRVVVGFLIQANGHVTDPRAASNTTGNPQVASCLVNEVGQWRLPDPPNPPMALELPFSR